MAIARPKRPEVIVSGTVQRVAPRTKKDSADVFRHDVELTTETGANLSVEFWNRDEYVPLPQVHDFVALVVEVSESQQYGASLGYVRDVTANDLDLIHSRIKTPAKG